MAQVISCNQVAIFLILIRIFAWFLAACSLPFGPMHPAYPTTRDFSAAIWLKQFASHLPTYAAKYQIADAETAALQGAARQFLAGLGEQVARVTQAIRQRAVAPGAWPASAVPWLPGMRAILPEASALGYRILSHAAYDPADGSALGLECQLDYEAP